MYIAEAILCLCAAWVIYVIISGVYGLRKYGRLTMEDYTLIIICVVMLVMLITFAFMFLL